MGKKEGINMTWDRVGAGEEIDLVANAGRHLALPVQT